MYVPMNGAKQHQMLKTLAWIFLGDLFSSMWK